MLHQEVAGIDLERAPEADDQIAGQERVKRDLGSAEKGLVRYHLTKAMRVHLQSVGRHLLDPDIAAE